MVATTFSSDTPNLVTDIVRRNGVAGNWVWWAFVLTGVSTVFFYAQAVAAIRRPHGSRVLRDPLLGKRGQRRARVPRRLPRPAVQLHDHGDGQPGRVQDRRHPLRPRALADAPRRRHPQRRVRRPLRPLGRARHRHDSVLHQDDGGDRGGVVRAESAAGRRPHRPHRQAVGHARARRTSTTWPCCPTSRTTGTWQSRCSSCPSPCSGGRCGIRARSRAAAATSRSACWRRNPRRTRSAPCSSSTSPTTCCGRGRGFSSRSARSSSIPSCRTSSARSRISIRACSGTTSRTRRC